MRLFEYIHQGGAIMYILLLLNIVGLALMFAKFLQLNKESKMMEETADGFAQGLSTAAKDSTEALIELAKQELATYISKMEKGLNTIKIIASISPLLGLLGTVIGVLIAFRVIAQSGLQNPADFAEGISMALITTVGGLIVAIPHYIGHNYLLGILDNMEANLERSLLSKVLK